MKNTSQEIFEMLLGAWDLEREINPYGRLRGVASFTLLNSHALEYVEEGVLTLKAGDVMPDVSKRYIYKLEDDYVAVYFDDGQDKGKLFHRLGFDKQGIARASYDCPPDQYKTVFTIKSPDEFIVEHDVVGPKKSYQITSRYKKRAS